MAKYTSKTSKSRKLNWLIFLCIYILGFGLLSLLGEAPNENPYHPLTIIAPLIILIGICGMLWSLCLPLPSFLKGGRKKSHVSDAHIENR